MTATLAFVKEEASIPLPPLREELNLFPGMPTLDGAPTWVLQDPVAHRFFQIGRREFELLSRWQLGTVDALLDAVAPLTLLQIEVADVEELLTFLATHNLLQVRGPRALQRLLAQHQLITRRDVWWLLKSYLFLSFPLVNPNDWLKRMLPYVRWLGSRSFLLVTLVCALAGFYLVQRQWSGFLVTFPHFFNAQGALILAATLGMVKVLHELGHAFVARHFGCNVPSMGVALMVMWPVLYTDASDAWRLTSRRQRLLVSAAGMAVELTLAAYATLLWSFLGDGLLRSVMFVLATSTWLLTLLVNLNPFMRFDGYYLLSDLLGVPNLQTRAFALGRWQLREWLFGTGQPVPEHFPQRTQKLLLFYAYGVWIYRFFLFLGIALLVYHFFFKLIGVLLMLVEIIWFIGMPIYNEMKSWHKLKPQLHWNTETQRSTALLVLLAVVLLFPWRLDVSAPALLQAEQHALLFGKASGRVADISVAIGDSVVADQLLVRLESPDLEYELAQGAITIATLTRELESRNLERGTTQERVRALREELQAALAEQEGRREELASLSLQSPFAGSVKELLQPLRVGDWLPASQPIVTVTGNTGSVVEGWVQETDLASIAAGNSGWFYPEDIYRSAVRVQLQAIDTASTVQLDEGYLASTLGGALPVRTDDNGALIPVQPVYRVVAKLETDLQTDLQTTAQAPDQVLRGTLKIAGARASLFGRAWRAAASVLIRESGF